MTFLIRLSLIYVPIKMQRFNARQSQFRPELQKFTDRIRESKREGDHMLGLFCKIFKIFILVHQIMMEQKDFLKQNVVIYFFYFYLIYLKDISPFKYFPLIGANTLVFMSQFFAIRDMAVAKYPVS